MIVIFFSDPRKIVKRGLSLTTYCSVFKIIPKALLACATKKKRMHGETHYFIIVQTLTLYAEDIDILCRQGRGGLGRLGPQREHRASMFKANLWGFFLRQSSRPRAACLAKAEREGQNTSFLEVRYVSCSLTLPLTAGLSPPSGSFPSGNKKGKVIKVLSVIDSRRPRSWRLLQRQRESFNKTCERPLKKRS